jgi:S1-C subfamily serine protease
MVRSARTGTERSGAAYPGRGLLGLAWFVALTVLAPAALALDVPRLAATAKPSVVLVTLYDERGEKVASGTGFFVSEDGKLVTNHHVIEGAVAAKASLSDGREVAIKSILSDDAPHDIAVVQCEGSGYAPLSIGDTSALHVGEDVVVVGSPLGLSTTVSTGIVAAVRDKGLAGDDRFDEEERKAAAAWGLQITAPVSHGSSGSPILDAAGEVVGVAVAVLGEGENINFGVPTVYVKAAIAAVGKSPPRALGARGSERKRNLLISLALVVAAGIGDWIVSRIVEGRGRPRRPAAPPLRH